MCKRLRQQCLCRALWVAALETLEYRPPFITSRSTLLDLSTADLRKEIIRAIKLDRSWLSESGPKKTSEELIPIKDDIERVHDIIPLPQVDLLIFSFRCGGIQCWCTSQKKIVWEYVIHEDDGMEREEFLTLSMACDVADDSSTVSIAINFSRDGDYPRSAR